MKITGSGLVVSSLIIGTLIRQIPTLEPYLPPQIILGVFLGIHGLLTMGVSMIGTKDTPGITGMGMYLGFIAAGSMLTAMWNTGLHTALPLAIFTGSLTAMGFTHLPDRKRKVPKK